MLTNAETWKECFAHWPKDVPHRGILVLSGDDQIPFEGFLTHENMLLVDRKNPDTMGARKVIVPYANIVAVKLVDVLKAKPFVALGFSGTLKE